MIPRPMMMVAQLLVGYPILDRSKVMTQTKMDTLIIQVGGWDFRLTTSHRKNYYCYETQKLPQ